MNTETINTEAIDTRSFTEQLREDRYLEVLTKTVEPGCFVDWHSHAYDVRALILAGELTIVCDDTTTTYRPGDILELERDREHTERSGPEGFTFLVGRRHPA